MNGLVKLSDVEKSIIEIRGRRVILDADVAQLYGVETREVNQAIKNNPDKFPEGYVIELNRSEFENLRSKFLIANISSKTRTTPKAFTEKGLYMLATILKGNAATQTTIAIVETFAKMRELSRTISELSSSTDQFRQKSLMEQGGEILSDLIGDDMQTSDTETTIELNFAVMKLKHTVKRKKQ